MQSVPDLAMERGITGPIPPEIHRLICLRLREAGIGVNSTRPCLEPWARRAFQARYAQDAKDMDRVFLKKDLFRAALFSGATDTLNARQQKATQNERQLFNEIAGKILRDWFQDPRAQRRKARQILGASLI